MDLFRLVVTVLVMAGVVVAILLFERRRADDIVRDTRKNARDRGAVDHEGSEGGEGGDAP